MPFAPALRNFRYSVERLFMLLSASMRLDGLWVGTLGDKKELDVIVEAFKLIRTYDPIRYRRIIVDLRRVWVVVLPGNVGEYDQAIATCKVDSRYAARTSAGAVALVIVHEATHARLRAFGYSERLRERLERICVRRERAFAGTLPSGDDLVEWVEKRLANLGDYSSTHLSRRRREGEYEAARELGVPQWVVGAAHRFRSR